MISKQKFRVKKDGTAYKYSFCAHPELIENYEEAMNDKTQIWVCHHRMEQVFSQAELIRAGWYYNRPASELIFLTPSEHNALFHIEKKLGYEKSSKKLKNKPKSEETRRKIGEANKISQKGKTLSEETRKKLSALYKGKHWKLVDGKRVWY